MFDTVQQFADWLQALPPGWIYLVLLGIAYGENVVPPIPGDVAVVIGGYLVGLGLIGFVPAVGVATLGGALGFMTMYALGVRLGDAVEDPNRVRWIPKGAVRTAKGWLRKWGYGVVAVNRFLSGARSVIALLVGASDLRAAPTALFATLSAAVWTALLTYAGYAVGANWAVILGWLRTYGRVVTAVVLVAVVVLVGRWWWHRRFRRAGPEAPRNREDPSG
ncbi:MAG: DedA family protein [Rubricoccaceae bacterium]|nr:DedA family protein [Rubricoccaceae bacterium]